MSQDDTVESIEPILRGLGRVVLAEAARSSRDAPASILTRVRAVRSLASSGVKTEDEPAYLTLLLDVARELDSVES